MEASFLTAQSSASGSTTSANLASIFGIVAFALTITLFYVGVGDWLYVRSLLAVTPGQFMLLILALSAASAGTAFLAGYRPPLLLLIVPFSYIVLIGIGEIERSQEYQTALVRATFMTSVPLLLISMQAISISLVRKIMLIALIVICVTNIADYFFSSFLPVPMSEIAGRAGGFHVNPNISAQIIALSLPLAVIGVRAPLRLPVYLLTLAGVFLTFSRGGVVLWFVAMLMTEAFLLRPFAVSLKIIIATLIGLITMAFIIVFGDQIAQLIIGALGPYLSPAVASRLYLDTHDFAANERRYAVQYGWDLFLAHPFFGSGLGGGDRWQFSALSHNMVVQTLAEFGLVGFGWLTLFLLMLRSIAGPLGGVLVCLWLLAAMFSHNLFDHFSISLIIALYAANAYGLGNRPGQSRSAGSVMGVLHPRR